MACRGQWLVGKLLSYRVQNASLHKRLQETKIVPSTFRDFEVERGRSSMLRTDLMPSLTLTIIPSTRFDAERWRSPAAESGSGGRVDRERGHCCLFSWSLSKLLVSLSISSSFPVDDIHSGQVGVPLAPFAFQMSSACHPSPCNGFSPSPTTTMAP